MTRYVDYPDHPLHGVPQESLDAAHKALDEACYFDSQAEEYKLLMDPDELEAVAEAVLAAAIPALKAAQRKRLANVWNMLLGYMIEDRLSDGTYVLEYVLATNPRLAEKLREVLG